MNHQFDSNYGLLVRSEEKGRGVLEVLTDKLLGNANSRMEMSATPAQDVYEIRPREERDGFDLIGDRLQDGQSGMQDPTQSAARSRTQTTALALARTGRSSECFSETGNVIETHEHAGRVQRVVAQFCSQGLAKVKLVYAKNAKWVLSGPHHFQKFAQ